MKQVASFILGLLLLTQVLSAATPVSGPESTLKAFYSWRIKSDMTGAPTAAQVAILRRWLTPKLCAQLAKAGQERDAFIKKFGNSEKPPWCEGDLFSSTFEGPTAFEIAGGTENQVKARYQVLFACSLPGQKPVRWADRVDLKFTDGKWLVDDVIYDLPVEFGNSRTLRTNLP